MHKLEDIADRIRQSFEIQNGARDRALSQARLLIRHCGNAIRAIHRNENTNAQEDLRAAQQLAESLRHNLEEFPDLYFAGYTQDALKEYAEASIVYALVSDHDLPTPDELGLPAATYLKGLAEVVGELRRRILDILRQGHSKEAERLLICMEDIYAILVTFDYPDAITGGLRRLTDVARSLIERTRGDVTISIRQEKLEHSIKRLEEKLESKG